VALQRVKSENYQGALLFAHHHPPYAIGSQHSSSTEMREQMDAICEEIAIWPHAILADHAHNYQRFTRGRSDETEIPYIICGNGGHNVQKIHPHGGPLRTPQIVQAQARNEDPVTLENYDDTGYGYLRITVDPQRLRIEYHPASDADQAKTPDDYVTVDLAPRKRTIYTANNMGFPEEAETIRQLHREQARESRTSTRLKHGPRSPPKRSARRC
jgi:hypothetical protein